MPTKKSVIFISRNAPYGSQNPQLCLDMALAYAVFEQHVNYVFMDDGVYQLKQGQLAAEIGRKTLGNVLETLSLYGIENVFVDMESLRARGMDAIDLVIPAALVTRAEIGSLLQKSDSVFNL